MKKSIKIIACLIFVFALFASSVTFASPFAASVMAADSNKITWDDITKEEKEEKEEKTEKEKNKSKEKDSKELILGMKKTTFFIAAGALAVAVAGIAAIIIIKAKEANKQPDAPANSFQRENDPVSNDSFHTPGNYTPVGATAPIEATAPVSDHRGGGSHNGNANNNNNDNNYYINNNSNNGGNMIKGTPPTMPLIPTSPVTVEPESIVINTGTRQTPIRIASTHNIGRRKNQEDSLGVSDVENEELFRKKGFMAVVADGMGGLKGGEDVSSAAVLTMLQGFSNLSAPDTGNRELTRLLNSTVQTVNDLLERTVGLKKSGSTLMAVIIHNMEVSWISVGDSRTCLYRNGKLTDLNHKHIYAAELQEMVRQGKISEQQAKNHPDRDKLTSYLGMGKLKYVDRSVRPLPLRTGDKIILMSDGIFNTLSDPEIEQILNLPIELIGQKLEEAVQQKRNPHQDNFTAVILEIPAD